MDFFSLQCLSLCRPPGRRRRARADLTALVLECDKRGKGGRISATEEPVSGSSLASNDANQITPQYECNEDNHKPVLEPPANVYDEQVGETSRRKVSSMTELNNTASLPAPMSHAEV